MTNLLRSVIRMSSTARNSVKRCVAFLTISRLIFAGTIGLCDLDVRCRAAGATFAYSLPSGPFSLSSGYSSSGLARRRLSQYHRRDGCGHLRVSSVSRSSCYCCTFHYLLGQQGNSNPWSPRISIYTSESDLLAPVQESLRRRGYDRQRHEVQFFEYSIDLYGFASPVQTTVAVELKLSRWSRAFEQGLVYQLCADYVYIALPWRAAKRVEVPLLQRHGLGLIGVQPGPRCVILCPAQQSSVVMPSYREFYVGLLERACA